jgi:hypothetical protein
VGSNVAPPGGAGTTHVQNESYCPETTTRDSKLETMRIAGVYHVGRAMTPPRRGR